MSRDRALGALDAAGLPYRLLEHGPVRSLVEAAQARGVEPADVIKTLVVRRGEGDFLFVLVPGDRQISWPKLRALLGVSRMSMPDAAAAKKPRYCPTCTCVSRVAGGEAGDHDACRERCSMSSLSEVRFLTVAEVAAIMRVSKMTVYRMVHSGELTSVRVGRSFRVPEQAVHEYLRGAFTEAG
ncbi:MAG: excisionase family DNA-binding protein [Actinobacteria bacterium]|nr:excisionase family DNA-binding protein [Actinomycetota bacterium]